MLKKENRVNKKIIEQIFRACPPNGKEGAFINSENLTFKFILNKNSNISAISFIVPKTISKSVVKRNILRRRGYFVLKNYLKKLPKNIMGVFIFSKKSLECFAGKKSKNYNPISNLEYEIKNILNKIN